MQSAYNCADPLVMRNLWMRGSEERGWSDPEGMTMENEVLITAFFAGAGLLAYAIIPGLLVI